jgi:NAD(P)-dependent dehydrogenase (short-subunit alcohol dehydrogenase family)
MEATRWVDINTYKNASDLAKQGWKIIAVGRTDHGYGETIDEAIAQAKARGDKGTKMFVLYLAHPDSYVAVNGDLSYPAGQEPLLLVREKRTGLVYTLDPIRTNVNTPLS